MAECKALTGSAVKGLRGLLLEKGMEGKGKAGEAREGNGRGGKGMRGSPWLF